MWLPTSSVWNFGLCARKRANWTNETACQVTASCIYFSMYKEILLSALKYATLAGFETAGTPRGEKQMAAQGNEMWQCKPFTARVYKQVEILDLSHWSTYGVQALKKKKKKFNLKQSHQAWAGAQPFYHYYVATGFIMKKKSLKERKLIWKSSLSPTRGRNLGVEVTWTGKQKALQLHKCHAGSTRGSSSPPSSFLQKHNRGIDTGRQFVSLIFFFEHLFSGQV